MHKYFGTKNKQARLETWAKVFESVILIRVPKLKADNHCVQMATLTNNITTKMNIGISMLLVKKRGLVVDVESLSTK